MVKHVHPHVSKHAPGQSVYERYLRTEELLSLQKPEDELVHHDELQFQIVHQVFELWCRADVIDLHGLFPGIMRELTASNDYTVHPFRADRAGAERVSGASLI